jgi:hypothetical protein
MIDFEDFFFVSSLGSSLLQDELEVNPYQVASIYQSLTRHLKLDLPCTIIVDIPSHLRRLLLQLSTRSYLASSPFEENISMKLRELCARDDFFSTCVNLWKIVEQCHVLRDGKLTQPILCAIIYIVQKAMLPKDAASSSQTDKSKRTADASLLIKQLAHLTKVSTMSVATSIHSFIHSSIHSFISE